MNIMLSDDRLQFREKVCKKHLAGTMQVTGHAYVLAALLGASHG
jgi:hypothetical protein